VVGPVRFKLFDLEHCVIVWLLVALGNVWTYVVEWTWVCKPQFITVKVLYLCSHAERPFGWCCNRCGLHVVLAQQTRTVSV